MLKKLLLFVFFIFFSIYSYAQQDWVDIIPQTKSPLSNGIYDNAYKIIPEFALSNDIIAFYMSLPIRSRSAIDNSSGSEKNVFDFPLVSVSMGLRIAPKWK